MVKKERRLRVPYASNQGYDEEFLLRRYEKGCRLMAKAMLAFLARESQTSEANWIASAFRYTCFEIGFYIHGFY